MFGWYQNCFYLCTRFSEVKHSGCSAVRLAHLLWEQGVVGSNPATPTRDKAKYLNIKYLAFLFLSSCTTFAQHVVLHITHQAVFLFPVFHQRIASRSVPGWLVLLKAYLKEHIFT